MKKFKLIYIILLLAITITGCSEKKNLYNSNLTNVELGNSSNSCGTITYEDYVYYTKCRSDDIKYDLYRLNTNTMEEEKIKDEVMLVFGVINERLIYIDFDRPYFEEASDEDGLYSMNIDGSDVTKFVEEGRLRKVFQKGNDIYAISSLGYLCKIDVESKSYNQIYDEILYPVFIKDESIYYGKLDEETYIKNIFELNIDTLEEKQITFLTKRKDEKEIIYSIAVFDEDIYCLVRGDEGTEKFGKFDEDKKTINYLLEERPVINQELIICGDYIVFACIGGTYKVKIGTDKVEKIFWKSSESITSINGYFSLLSNKKRIAKIYNLGGDYINTIKKGYYKGNGAMYRELLEKQREETN